MIAGIIALVLTVLGAGLIVTGVLVSLSDRKRKIEEEEKDPKLRSEGFAGETLGGLAKLAEALKDQPLGLQLILIGVALLALAGATGGVGALAATV